MTEPDGRWNEIVRRASGDFHRHAAVMGVETSTLQRFGGVVDGDAVRFPAHSDGVIGGFYSVNLSGAYRVDGRGIAMTATPRKTGVMVAAGILDAASLADLGFSVIAVPGDGRCLREAVDELASRRSREVVTWWSGDLCRMLLRSPPPSLDRCTQCFQPSEWASVHEWVMEGKPGREGVIARVEQIREAWASRGGRLSV